MKRKIKRVKKKSGEREWREKIVKGENKKRGGRGSSVPSSIV